MAARAFCTLSTRGPQTVGCGPGSEGSGVLCGVARGVFSVLLPPPGFSRDVLREDTGEQRLQEASGRQQAQGGLFWSLLSCPFEVELNHGTREDVQWFKKWVTIHVSTCRIMTTFLNKGTRKGLTKNENENSPKSIQLPDPERNTSVSVYGNRHSCPH